MTGTLELKVLGERKKEDKGRMVELMKGYMRFIKFRGFILDLLKFVS